MDGQTAGSLRLALVQMNPVVGDVDGNRDRVAAFLRQARADGAQLIVFPEMVLSGYPPEDLLFRSRFLDRLAQAAESLQPETAGVMAIYGYPREHDGLYNVAEVVADGVLVDRVRKQYLPNYGVFDEERYFRPGTSTAVYHWGPWTLGVSICEDIWYPDGPYLDQVRAGANLLINISASPYSLGKGRTRETMLVTRAQDTATYLAWCNTVGGQDELVFDGQSLVAAPDGRVLARGQAFAEEVLYVDLPLGWDRHRRRLDPRWWRSHRQEIGQAVRHLVVPEPQAPARPPIPPAVAEPLTEEAELYRALVTGVHDYVGKNGFGEVVIGLSGGIDSSLTAVVAVDALGPERVHGVLMPSPITSRESVEDAARLADNLGIDTLTLAIGPVMAAFDSVLAAPFAGRSRDVTEENLQARIRGNLLMALSNKFGWLVLTTGNKSELATGYSTLYGDMAGGFAVIKDVLKTDVYRLARYVNRAGERIPARVLVKPPTAELSPGQTDQDTLPPYAILDQILKGYVEDDRSAEELIAAGLPAEAVRRTAAMVNHNEYKRRQAAVGIKVTPRAFGRDRRMPITARFD